MMHRNFLITASFLAALAVTLGAFAAHKLKDIFAPEILQVFETAVKYQMYHAMALLAVGILYGAFPVRQLVWAGNLFIAGMLLFSGSLYILCIVKHLQVSALWVGAITPFGGACFIVGWLMIAMGVSKKATVQ
jgi:uncharacterized membrane protein YgdD (TMEM256/DUF423 family)